MINEAVKMHMNTIQNKTTAERSQSIDDFLRLKHGQKMSAAEVTATNPPLTAYSETF